VYERLLLFLPTTFLVEILHRSWMQREHGNKYFLSWIKWHLKSTTKLALTPICMVLPSIDHSCLSSSSFAQCSASVIILQVTQRFPSHQKSSLACKGSQHESLLILLVMSRTVKEETRLNFIANLILRESWYKPVPAIATLTLNRFQFFCNFITSWSKMSKNKGTNQHGNFL
jgi:hypothetical protein